MPLCPERRQDRRIRPLRPIRPIDLEMLVCVSGRERTEQEFAALMSASGWSFRRVIPNRSSVSIVEGAAA